MPSTALAANAEIEESAPAGAPTKVRHLQFVLAVLGLLWLGCEIAALAGVGKSPLGMAYANSVADPFYQAALAGSVLIFFVSRPTGRDLAGLLGAGLAASLALKGLGLALGNDLPLFCHLLLGFALASVSLLARRVRAGTGPDRERALALLLLAALIPGFTIINAFFIPLSIELCPSTYDGLLYAVDGAFGAQPSFLAGQLLVRWPLLANVAMVVYNTLPFEFVLVLLLQLRVGRLPNGSVFWPFISAAVVGFLVYLVFPVVGPVYLFEKDFPHAPPAIHEVLAVPPAVPDVPRNCMPSLHTTWVLLLWWHARPLARWARALAGTYLVFTLLATLGYGVHYACDLLVAFPFALAIQAAWTPGASSVRRWAVGGGAALTLFWLLLLLLGWRLLAASPVLLAVGTVLTVAGSLLGERLLYRAARGHRLPNEAPAPLPSRPRASRAGAEALVGG